MPPSLAFRCERREVRHGHLDDPDAARRVRRDVAARARLRAIVGLTEANMDALGLLVTAGLLIYLTVALLKPEYFS